MGSTSAKNLRATFEIFDMQIKDNNVGGLLCFTVLGHVQPKKKLLICN